MKNWIKGFSFIFIAGFMVQCTTNKVVSTPTVSVPVTVNLEGKWGINKGKTYMIFEPTTKKVMVKSVCNYYHANYQQDVKALSFQAIGQTDNDCSDVDKLDEKLLNTVYFKAVNAKMVVLYDKNDQEILTLSQ